MNPLRAWNRFWFAPASARPLGLFRIAFGVLALANLGLLAADLNYWFTSGGLVRGADAADLAGPLRYSPLQTWQSPAAAWGVTCALAASLVLFTLGWHARIMGVAVYLLQLALHHRNIASINEADTLLMATSFALMLSPCGAAFSLDARRKARRLGDAPAEPLIEPWAQRLIQVQLCLVYLMCVLAKCRGAAWLDGTALHYMLNNPELGRFRLDPLSQYPLVLNALTLGSLAINAALPFLLWSRQARPFMLAGGLLLHAGGMLTMNMPLFNELCLASFVLFMTPAELSALARPFRALGLARESGAAGAAIPAEIRGRLDAPHVAARPAHAGRVGAAQGTLLAGGR